MIGIGLDSLMAIAIQREVASSPFSVTLISTRPVCEGAPLTLPVSWAIMHSANTNRVIRHARNAESLGELELFILSPPERQDSAIGAEFLRSICMAKFDVQYLMLRII